MLGHAPSGAKRLVAVRPMIILGFLFIGFVRSVGLASCADDQRRPGSSQLVGPWHAGAPSVPRIASQRSEAASADLSSVKSATGTRPPTNRYGLSVKEQRWPWVLTAGLMLASAVAAAWSTYLYWLPCHGSMLDGTLIQPYTDDGRSYEEFENDPAVKARMFACERRMDGDDAPWTSELNIAATALLGVAWLALVPGMRWQARTKAVAHFPV